MCNRDCGETSLRGVATILTCVRVGTIRRKDPIMRTFETATNAILAVASLALVAGVFVAL